MNFHEKFDPPFKKDGKPQKYLRLLTPLFDKDFTRKEEMLRVMGVDVNNDPKWRGKHSTTLAKLSKEGVLSTKSRGSGFWKRGPNWDAFMGWVMSNLPKNDRLKVRDMLIRYDTNILDFIMKE